MDMKKKVLTINCTYDKGSTGKIIMDIAKSLKDSVDFIFCYEDGPKSYDNRYRIAGPIILRMYYLLARLVGLKHSTGVIPTFLLIRKIKKENPDVVHLHCPYDNLVHIPMLIKFLKRNNIKTVVTNHAEFYYTGNCPYSFDCLKFQTGCGNCNYVFDSYRKYMIDRTKHEWKLMYNAFSNAKNITMVAVSPWVKERMLLSPISASLEKRVVVNGIDASVFHWRENIQNNTNFSNYVLHVTASFTDDPNDIKGGFYVIQIARKCPEITFVIAGPVSVNPKLKLPKNIKLLGSISDRDELASFYRNARVTLITSRFETFSMICAESLSCGTPIVGFNAGGPESITIKKYSDFVEYGNVEKLISVMKKWMNSSFDAEKISEDALNSFASDIMAKNYFMLYTE